LSNYVTALDYADDGELYRKFWLDNPSRVHAIGKGISRFHCIYWPAMLLSAGLPLPTEIFIHGYITVEGEKISKSLGNTIDPVELVEKFGVEPVRYYLLREISAYEDGDYSEAKFRQRYESDLANGLGNAFSRVTTMVANFLDGKVNFEKQDSVLPAEVDKALAEYRFDQALLAIMGWIKQIDEEIDQTKPWQLAKAGQTDELGKLLGHWCSILVQVAWALTPFMPQTAKIIKEALAADKITKVTPLFPRLK